LTVSLASDHETSITSRKNTKKHGHFNFAFYAENSSPNGKKINQNGNKNRYIFQNGPFYIAEWPILLFNMIHSARPNGPF